MKMDGSTLKLRVELRPRLAELLPPDAPGPGTRKTHARAVATGNALLAELVAGTAHDGVELVVPHSPIVTEEIRRCTEDKCVPFSEDRPLLIIECLQTRTVVVWDDIDEVKDIEIKLPHVRKVPRGTCIVFRQQTHSYNREKKRVLAFGGAGVLELTRVGMRRRHQVRLVDFSDTDATEGAPDFMAPWGSGFCKGEMEVMYVLDMDESQFEGPVMTKEELQACEAALDATVYRNVSRVFDMTDEIGPCQQPLPLSVKGTAPMQAPVYRIICSPGKLPGGAWSMLRMRRKIPAALWAMYTRTALDRYSRMAAAIGTPLWRASEQDQERWFKDTVKRQFERWGPKEKRVHPEFHLAAMVTFHAICMWATSLFYTDDHTNENAACVELDDKKVKVGNNQRLAEEDLSGDCDTFAGAIIRFWLDLVHYVVDQGVPHDDAQLILTAQAVARLYDNGMPHSSVSSASVQREESEEAQNHMYALAIPRNVCRAMMVNGGVSETVLHAAAHPYGEPGKYEGREWHWYLQNMVEEGTGALNPWPMPTWLSACSWLYAEDPSVIPVETRQADAERALLIAKMEQATLVRESFLAHSAQFPSPAMMLYDDPMMTLREFANAGAKASHFYQCAMGYQTPVLEKHGIPLVDLDFVRGTGAEKWVGARYSELMLTPLAYAAMQRGEQIHKNKIITLAPTWLSMQEMQLVRKALETEPKPDPPRVLDVAHKLERTLGEQRESEVSEPTVEVTYFVRLCDYAEFAEKLAGIEGVVRVRRRIREMGGSSTAVDMDVVVVDMTLAMPLLKADEAAPAFDGAETQLQELRVALGLADA